MNAQWLICTRLIWILVPAVFVSWSFERLTMMERWWQRSYSGMALMRDWPPWNISRRKSWHKPAPAVSQIQFPQSVFHSCNSYTFEQLYVHYRIAISSKFITNYDWIWNIFLLFLIKTVFDKFLVWLNWKLLFRSMLTLTFVYLIHRLVIMENVTVNCTWKRKVTMVTRRFL